MNNSILDSGLTNRDGDIVLFISRRGAGVWTNLPSLSFEFLRISTAPSNILWIDLGLRYEMLNHFRIQPGSFPFESCLAGIAAALRTKRQIDITKIVSYDATLSWTSDMQSPLSVPSPGISSAVSAYSTFVSALAAKGKRVYMVPLHAHDPTSASSIAGLKTDELDWTIATLLRELKPTCTIFTCEGQPEAHLFTKRLSEDKTLQWCLGLTDTIVCMVRHDSEQRFCDGVAIPSLLSRNPVWRDRIRIILTRASSRPPVPFHLANIVLGHLPFAEFVGESVSGGRIPVIDLLCKMDSQMLSGTESEYLHCLNEIAKKLFCTKLATSGVRGED